MPLYVGDYLQDTMHLTAEQHGAYFLLILACWKRGGSLPSNEAQLATIARLSTKQWQAHRETLAGFFQIADDSWSHKRVSQELAKSTQITEARAKAGAIGAANRWQKNSDRIANASPTHRQTDAPSQSQSHVDIPPSLRSVGSGAKRLPTDWQPSPECIDYAVEQGLDPNRIAEEFRDYWHAESSAKARKRDWEAAWRTWCRRAADSPKTGRNLNGRSAKTPVGGLFEGAALALRDRARERERSAHRGADHDPAEPLLDG